MISTIGKFVHNKLFKWKVEENALAEVENAIVACYPHTTAFDGLYSLSHNLIDPSYKMVARSTGFYGSLYTFLNQYVVERPKEGEGISQTTLIADKIKSDIKNGKRVVLFMSPEGSRSKQDKLKSGFYHIAVKAGIPIIFGNYDYRNRKLTYSKKVHHVTDEKGRVKISKKKILKEMQMFFSQFPNSGLHPEKMTPIRF